MSRIMAKYSQLLVSRPIPTKMVTSGLLFGVGDCIAQKLGSPEQPHDFQRTMRASVFGFVFNGIVGHLHYQFLDTLVCKRFKTPVKMVPWVKVFIEQFVYWSWVSNGAYLYGMARLEGEHHHAGVDRVRNKIMDLQFGQWAFWIPVQWVNFKVVPVHWQLNYVLFFSIAWTTYLSLFTSAATSEEEDKGEAASSSRGEEAGGSGAGGGSSGEWSEKSGKAPLIVAQTEISDNRESLLSYNNVVKHGLHVWERLYY